MKCNYKTTNEYKISSSQLEVLTKMNPKRYQLGETVYLTDKDKIVMWNGLEWTDMPEGTTAQGKGGLNMNLYELNKTIVAKLPILEDYTAAEELIQDYMEKNGESYMLLCKDISYYTIFQKKVDTSGFTHFETLGEAVLECANDIGKIISVDLTEDGSGIELWLRTPEDENLCAYFFDCSGLIVTYAR